MPANAFWSLAMYQIEADGRLFFHANPLGRYSIGNRTAGLKRNAQGEIEIMMTTTDPSEEQANWLPSPDGPFSVIFRAYVPSWPFLDGSWRLPPVRRI
jgi:hypothetical protein